MSTNWGKPDGEQGAGNGERRRRRRRVSVAGVIVMAVVAVGFGVRQLDSSSPATRARRSVVDEPGAVALDPAYFASGSCVAFPPTSGNRHATVFLDAGHGGLDPGSIGTTEAGQTIYEADETLPVELDTMALLRAQGFRVVVSRTRASTVVRPESGDVSDGAFTVQGEHRDVAARDVCANQAKADILIGIYFDAGTTSQDGGSVTGYDPDRPLSPASLKLADLVQNDVVTEMNAQGWGIPSEGVLTDSGLGGPALSNLAAAYGHLLLLGPASPGYFSTPSEMPGVLIEPLFITDPFEGSIAASTNGQQVIAHGLAEAVEQYFGPKSASVRYQMKVAIH